MIYEILIQHVEPEKRDEYIKVFGDILKKANYAGSLASTSSPVSKIRAGSFS